MNKIQILIVALLGASFSSCSVDYSGPRRGPMGCGSGGYGYPQGMPHGPGYGPWARNYVPGNAPRDGRYYDARRRANEVHFDFNQFDQHPPAINGYVGGSHLQPSGRTVVCPGCKNRIGNAPSGRFQCQRCGETVLN